MFIIVAFQNMAFSLTSRWVALLPFTLDWLSTSCEAQRPERAKVKQVKESKVIHRRP